MKLSRISGLLIGLALLMPSCVYGNFGHPLDTDVNNTELGSKRGESKMQSVMWLVAWGDSGAAAAAKNGDIKIIRHMDSHTFYLLWGLYYEGTTIVYGD